MCNWRRGGGLNQHMTVGVEASRLGVVQGSVEGRRRSKNERPKNPASQEWSRRGSVKCDNPEMVYASAFVPRTKTGGGYYKGESTVAAAGVEGSKNGSREQERRGGRAEGAWLVRWFVRPRSFLVTRRTLGSAAPKRLQQYMLNNERDLEQRRTTSRGAWRV